MRNRLLRVFTVGVIAAFLIFQGGAHTNTAKAVTYSSMAPIQKRLVSGLAELELNPQNAALLNGPQVTGVATPLDSLSDASARRPKNYYPGHDGACPMNLGDNV